MDGIDVLGEKVQVVNNVAEVGRKDKLGDLVTQTGQLLIGRLESSLCLGRKVEDEGRLVNLHGLSTSLLELDKELLVNRQELVEKVNGVNSLATVGFAKVEERNRTNKDWASLDTSLLGLVEFNNSLGAVDQLKGLVVLESRLHVVVVGIEPLDHFQAGHVNATLLVATTHGKVLVNIVKAILGVSLGNSLRS